ncbi:cytochrome C [Pyrobaculum aerophilum]|uniref:Cytochrome C n=2 Tax=Pyrobaculum aerophilum TaxID=13773 RepID=A0A371R513_9CREN|nr:cytochrome C [Pyrobaculum aerophilum]RFA99091.1 cytochrome C [Pyrobaculum aerophilum]
MLTGIIITAVVIIAIVAALTLSGLGAASPAPPATTPAPSPTATPTPTTPTQTPPPQEGGAIQYDPNLAQKGIQYFKEVGCTACHSIKSLGISGGAFGPDLSKALISPATNVQGLARFYKENGLDNPAADPQKAAQLLAQYLINPPSYSTTMVSQINTHKSLFGDQWEKDYVPALVEMLKMAATR